MLIVETGTESACRRAWRLLQSQSSCGSHWLSVTAFQLGNLPIGVGTPTTSKPPPPIDELPALRGRDVGKVLGVSRLRLDEVPPVDDAKILERNWHGAPLHLFGRSCRIVELRPQATRAYPTTNARSLPCSRGGGTLPASHTTTSPAGVAGGGGRSARLQNRRPPGSATASSCSRGRCPCASRTTEARRSQACP